jgi:hypothetical protein
VIDRPPLGTGPNWVLTGHGRNGRLWPGENAAIEDGVEHEGRNLGGNATSQFPVKLPEFQVLYRQDIAQP